MPVYDWQAASWFYPNTISIWEKEDYIKNKISEQEHKKISEELCDIMSEKSNISHITWKMKKIIIKH